VSSPQSWILRLGKRREWERRLLAEFLRKEYPTTPYATNVRLGSIPPEFISRTLTPAQARQFSRFKRYCDGVIFLPDKSIIVEAKMRADPGIVTMLELYKKLFQETPDLKERWDLPIEMMLVYSIEDPVTVQLAREHNVRAIQYVPSWLWEYLKSIAPYKREGSLPSGGRASI